MKHSKEFLKVATAILCAAMTLVFVLVSCAPISDVGGSASGGGSEATININLPHFASSQSVRSIAPDDLPELQMATKSFRVTFISMDKTVVREVSSETTNVQAEFYIGTEVSVVIECLNASREVIVRTVQKTIKVRPDNNTISFKLSEDGTKIEPEPTDKYTVSYALADGAWGTGSPQPTTKEYSVGEIVTITSNRPTKQDNTFSGWRAVPATLNPVDGSNLQGGGSFTMPASNVTLTAVWTSSRDDVIEIDSVDKLKEYAEKMQNGTNVTYPNGTSVRANEANYRLTRDLDLQGDEVLLGESNYHFSGDFDGNGYKIKNLKNTETPLFWDVDSGGIIRNLILESVNITSNYGDQSPFAMTMKGKLIGCQVSGTIESNFDKHGLAYGAGTIVGCLSSIEKDSVDDLCGGNGVITYGAAFATDTNANVDTLNGEISNWNASQAVQNDSRLRCDWHFERSAQSLTLVKGAPSPSEPADSVD